MYTELIKIIEGGLRGDKEKVLNYSLILSQNLKKTGETNISKRILRTIDNKRSNLASLDSLNIKPVDVESRLEMVEVKYIGESFVKPILNRHLDDDISNLVLSYSKRDEIMKAGIKSDNSLLLYGPPGCGKTTLAYYLSQQTGLPLVTVRLDGMVSSLLGSTAKNIRKIFNYASKRDCILFLDEFDVVAKFRDDKNELGELKRVVNSLLQNIDDFGGNSILVAATNHHKLLDPAVWRRFSTILHLDLPEAKERKEYLKRLLMNFKNEITESRSKFNLIIDCFNGRSYSDIETVVNNAIRKAIIRQQKILHNYDLLFEIYMFINHEIADENDFVKYLLDNAVTQREVNENLGYSLRRIREVSKI